MYKLHGFRIRWFVVMQCVAFKRMCVLETASAAPATCVEYAGDVCNREERKGVPMKYHVPIGKTQQQIDKEINDALEENPFKYIACKRYIRYLMCEDKFRSCNNLKVPCQGTCYEVKDSMCFKHIKKNSKIYHWFHNEFICSHLSEDEGACEPLYTQLDYDIAEESCRMEGYESGSGFYQMSIIHSTDHLAKLHSKNIARHFRMESNNDLNIIKGKRSVNSIIKKDISLLKTVVVDRIKERQVHGYFYSPSTKTTIIPIATLKHYKPSLQSIFKNVEVVLVERESDKKVTMRVIGQNSICLEYGNFHYNIYEQGNLAIYHGVSSTSFQWKWVEQAESNPEGDGNIFVLDLLRKMRLIQSLVLKEPTQIIVWNNTLRFKLFKDQKSNITLDFPDMTAIYDEKNDTPGEQQYKYKSNRRTFTNIKTQVAIVGQERSVAFDLTFITGMKYNEMMWLIIGEEYFDNLEQYLNFKAMDDYMPIETVNLYLQMKHSDLSLPALSYFSDIKHILKKHENNRIFVKATGKVLEKATKPAWFDNVNYTFTYRMLKHTDSTILKYRVEFYPDKDDQCSSKQETKRWIGFKRLLSVIDYLQKDYYEDDQHNIKKLVKTIDCSICCKYNVHTLKYFEVDLHLTFSPSADITFVLLKKNKQITYSVKSLWLLFNYPNKEKVDSIFAKSKRKDMHI